MYNILKMADSRAKWMKLWDSIVLRCRLLSVSDSLRSIWGHSVQFTKFLIKFSKGYTAPSFCPVSNKRDRKYVLLRRKYRLLLFLVICQIWKVYGTLKISHLSYIVIIHKGMWISSSKGQAEHQGPWASCCITVPVFLYFSKTRQCYYG